ncbi:MAG TPA: SAM-dependent methyltransferase, partial [Actinopolymorphaceae bacterium]
EHRFPDSSVHYTVADVLAPPQDWVRAFDLVVEIYTVQVLRGKARATAIERIASLPAPGGTLLVVARARHRADPPGDLPWPLTREEIEAFAVDDLELERLEDFTDEEGAPRWRAEFTRRAPAGL